MTAVALAVALALAAPAGGEPPPAPPRGAAQPSPEAADAVRKLMERELPPFEPKPFRTASGISGAVEAAASPATKEGQDAEELTIPIGTEQAISCSALPKRVDAAGALWRVTESVKEKVTLLGVQLTDVSEVNGSPLALALAVYEVSSGKGPMVGLLKLGVYVHDAHSLLCVHDEPGYQKTFARIVKGLAASLKGGGADERGAARYAELSVMRVGEVPIGFSERTLVAAREGGGRTVQEYSAQLVPRGPADLVSVDGYSREEIDAKDLLVMGTYVHASNGELDTKMSVTRQKDGTSYAYDGEKEGKKLAGKFKTKAGVSTEFWFARRVAGSAPVPKKALVHEGYSHEANPVAAVPVSYAAAGSAPRRVTMKLGPLQVEGDLDANGLFETAEIPIAGTKLLVERIFVRGAP